MFDFNNPDNWQQIYAQQKVAANQTTDGKYEPIQDFTVFCDYSIIAIGSRNTKAYYNWQLGCWCFVTQPNAPSLGNQLGDFQFGRYAVPLNQFAVLKLDDLVPPSYTLYIKVPKWHRELYLEVWGFIQ